MKKRIILSFALVLLMCAAAAAALVGYKAYGAYVHLREKIYDIEDISADTLKKLEQHMGRYDFDYSWLEENKLVAHALGGIDGQSYTNSLEALETAYSLGYRVFEGDMQLLDGRAVLIHDGDEHVEAMGLVPGAYSYEDFMQAKIYGKYTPLDAAAIIRFLNEHPDAYFMTDSKYTGNPHAANVLSAFAVSAMEYDVSVLDRVIVQIYNQDMLDAVMSLYPFKSVVYTLYQSRDTQEEAIRFCQDRGIGAVTASHGRMTEEFAAALCDAGIKPLVHTLNDPQEIEHFFNIGVCAVYSDFALPEELGA